MKTFIFILLGIVVFNSAFAQNTLDKLGLTASTPATAAYSLRLLSSAYTGYAVQVRRIDNSVLDIGFTVNGLLDSMALKAFVGSENGYITTWYDQSGNGYNATQTSEVNQPQIVVAGIIEKHNLNPYMTYSGAQWLILPISSVRETHPNFTVNMVYQNTNLTGNQGLWGCDDGGWDRLQLLSFGGNAFGLSNGGGTTSNATNNTNRNIYTAIMNHGVSNGTYTVVNGAIGTTFTEGGGGSTTNLAIGAIASGNLPFKGNTSEFLAFRSSLLPAEREIIEANQQLYYDISPALESPVLTNFPDQNKMYFDRSITITPPASTSDGAFTYSSSNLAVATISGNTIAIVGAGQSTITATQVQTATYLSKSITALLKIDSVSVITKDGALENSDYNYVNRNGALGFDSGLNPNGELIITRSAGN